MNELNLKWSWHHNCGDATSTYEVIPSRPCTVKEFIELVLSGRANKYNHWGDIDIIPYPGVTLCKYDKGAAQYNEQAMATYGDKLITKIWANGGYGLMSYDLRVEGANRE